MCPSTGVIRLDYSMAIELPRLRYLINKPLSPTSVCRTPERNLKVKGHPRSLHLTENPVHPTGGCMAADLYQLDWDSELRLRFARLCWSLGWSIGLEDRFIHVDRRVDIGLRQTVYTYDGRWHGFDPERVCDPVKGWR